MSHILLTAQTKRLLTSILSDRLWETEWIDLLSQLEYVGCRKIIKSVDFRDVGSEVLQHIAEEAQHALLLKRIVDQRRGRRSWIEGRFQAAGWEYFQTLDHQASAEPSSLAPYQVTSWIVEQRVLALYPFLEQHTQDATFKRALNSILAQERRHGDQFEVALSDPELRTNLLHLEAQIWHTFEVSVPFQA